MLPLLLVIALGQALPSPSGPIVTNPATMNTTTPPYFAVFPLNGSGVTGGPCTTTQPTGSQGEALTMPARGTTAFCSKTANGGTYATTGIANGDLVNMTSTQMRVEYSTTGVLAGFGEEARTNSLLRSQEIDNASWTKGGAIGTITANYATAPDGTLTADRYQYSNTNNDYILQNFNCSATACADSVYLRGTSGSGTINVCRGGAVGQCVSCSYVSTSWSRCVYAATLASSNNIFLGCETGTLGSACSQTGLDVLVWGVQGEVGQYATSYIPTNAAGATRNPDLPYRDNGSTVQINSIAVNYEVPAAAVITAGGTQGIICSNNAVGGGSPPLGFIINGTILKGFANPLGYTASGTTLTSGRINASVPTGGLTFRWSGGSSTLAGSPTGLSQTFHLGSWNSTGPSAFGSVHYWDACFDTSEARCR